MIFDRKIKILLGWIFLAMNFIFIDDIQAIVCPNIKLSGDVVLSTDCKFSGTVNGVENGDLTISQGVNLTIDKDQELVWNNGYSVFINGNLILNKTEGSGAKIRKGYIIYPDSADREYPDSLIAEFSDSVTPPSGYKRRSDPDFTSKWTYVSEMTTVGGMSCAVRSSCLSGESSILKISGTSNAHAELPTQSNYSNNICCGAGGATIGNTCSGNYATVLKLFGGTNSHVEKNTQASYSNSACLSSSFGTPTCSYSTDCSLLGSDYSCLASISGDTNAQIGNCDAYSTKVCCGFSQ